MWVNQKRKKLDKIWSAGAKPERKERFFSTQLISQESPAMEINYLEGNGPEWLMHKGLLLVLTESMILWGRKGINLLVYACHFNSLSIFFLVFLFSFFLSHSFLSVSWSIFSDSYSLVMVPIVVVPLPPFLFTTRVSFYSVCRDWILLF